MDDSPRFGYGVYTYADGGRYEGEWRNDKPHGYGVYTHADGRRYEGEWYDDKRHGRGTLTLPDGTCYEGEWRDGMPHRGTQTLPDGTRYEGDFRDGKYHGRGVNTSADGRSRYEGDWRNDKAHGHGVNTSAGGGRYEGNWRNGERHGHGVYTHTDGRRYDGEWRNDKPHGYGVVTFADGFRYEGNWRNGEPHGDGVLTFADGSTMSLGDSDGVAEDLHTGDRQAVPLLELEMSKYSFEANLTLTKQDIAILQLEDAIDLFLARKWISAVTLAGAAEEIFARLLNLGSKPSAVEETWEHIEEVRAVTGLPYAESRTKKEAIREWNEMRNALKHHSGTDKDPLTFSAFDAAFEMINRANINGEHLEVRARNRQDYENWCIENIFLTTRNP